ncbi:hypothetical protein MUK42_26404 [Musa troglodytarum]|uniref:Uncharacterized protein n=1 Tax=Musa troglodytarum TaxID=320322 RepID=A0A9E7HGA4_9LILI|nr:hypothetical protein MUK42_26404 [Musa troglodytarum]
MMTEGSPPRDATPKSKLNPVEPVIQIPGPHPSDGDRPTQQKTHRDLAPSSTHPLFWATQWAQKQTTAAGEAGEGATRPMGN